MANLKIIEDGSITSPKGFEASTTYVGIKSKASEKPDIAIVMSDRPAASAAVFTKNKFAAAPVIYDREILKRGTARAIFINSGNANAATGERGLKDTKTLAKYIADAMGISGDEVFISSTGVIGVYLPLDRMLAGVDLLVKNFSSDNGHKAAQAIMTTDTVQKEKAVEVELSGGKVKIGAMAKGSGMIHPNMATMLGFITTDASVSSSSMQQMLRDAADKSFNMLTVDGDTSTNDSLIMLANGASGVKAESKEDIKKLSEAVEYICVEMAKKIAADGEGATHMLIVNAKNLPSEEDARKVAKAVAGSTLFKCAIFGQDANWGRIISAAGYSGAEFAIDKIDVSMESVGGLVNVMKNGAGIELDEELASKVLAEKEITVNLDFHDGSAAATAFGCDMTYDYVKINGDYRS